MKVSKKMIFGQKIIFDLVNGDFGHWGPQNDQPSGQTIIYRKTEVIQSYLKIWGRYNPTESGPSEPKKWGFHRCSVKKCRFSGQKCAPAAGLRPTLQQGQHKIVAFWMSSHDGNKKIEQFKKKMDLGPKNCIFWPEILHFFTLHL